MAFWQSPEWMTRADSIYTITPGGGDPEPMPWWKEVWTLYRRHRPYDVILTMGIRESFAFAALCLLTGRKPCHIMTEVFIDAPRSSSAGWRIKTALYRSLARRAAGIITNSTAEISTNAERFRIPVSRFCYVPLNTTIDQPEHTGSGDGYGFCAGRTLRDYRTLLEVIRKTTIPWVVVGGAGDLVDIALPDRVRVHREISLQTYLDLLKRASWVVLPLLPTERSTGQVVLLEAMSYGKPVITTDAPGTRDIVRDEVDGFLVPPGNPDAILTRLHQLFRDPEKADRMGHAAVASMKTTHSTAEHTRLRLQAIESFWKAWRQD